MGKLNMIHVDYRMVHRQIVMRWIRFRPVDHLILADGSLVDDPFVGDAYHMAVPNREVDITKLRDVQTVIDRKNGTVLLIFEDMASVYTVYRSDLQLPELNIDAVQNSAQRKTVVQGVALTVEEYEELSEMKAEDVSVFLQPIPESDPVSLGSIERKLK